MFKEEVIENTVIEILKQNGYQFIEKQSDIWLNERLNDEFINKNLLSEQLKRINNIDDNEIIQEAINRIQRIENPSLFECNFEFHKILINGCIIESKKFQVNPLIHFIDFTNPENNVFQISHQVPFQENQNKRIPDIVVFINGIPLIIMELKSFDENATAASLEDAYKQLGGNSEHDGYRFDIPTLFKYNAFLIISDGTVAKIGTLTSKIERYNEWKSENGEKAYEDNCVNKLSIAFNGIFKKDRIIDIIKNNIFFMQDKNDKPKKIISQYHQYFGVKKALKSILNALKPKGNGKAGIIWHTQGSGKSFSMVMLSHMLLTNKQLRVPTIVILTDRIDLDNQLYKVFYNAKEYLKCEPISVDSRKDLVDKLGVLKQGGIIFVRVREFDKNNLPKNNRDNIVVMVDEAHRSHYGIYEKVYYNQNKDTRNPEASFKYGIEKYIRDTLPNATFIGFTGTPISTKEKQTTDIFGEIIDTYDMTQSIIDGSTVKLYYESRLAKVWADQNLLKKIDKYYDDLEKTNKSDPQSIRKSQSEMSKMTVILESDNIIKTFATDILEHYESRKLILNGKAMIVCETRNAALKLYKEIIKQKPQYKKEVILVVTESNKDTQEERRIFGNASYRKELGNEFKKDNSKYKIAVVCDMWLTGFDVPDLDVMYFIKRLKSYNLMQAIARVNRVYPGKVGGLIVDYIGIEKFLTEAISEYTARDQKNNVKNIRGEIYNILKEKLNILNNLFAKIDKSNFYSVDSAKRFSMIQKGADFVLQDSNLETLFLEDLSLSLKHSFSLCTGLLSVEEKNDILFYLAIRSFILRLHKNKFGNFSTLQMNEYVSNILTEAIKGDEVKLLSIDNSKNNSTIDLLNKEKIEELRKTNPPHIFIQILKKLFEISISASKKINYLKSQQYSERLRRILEEYNNRNNSFSIETSINKLISFASEMVEDETNANKLGISGRERAFYDALIKNKSINKLLNDETLKLIAVELNQTINEYSTVDWAHKEGTMAKMRIKIKECLKKYNYPPEYEEITIENVIKQAEYTTMS
ncbi:type I restriction endonuclease subunit R [Metamycoplasma hominis]